jgi:RND family efflux transporter MFP subunit
VRKGQEVAVIDSSVERIAAESAKYRSEMLGATRAAESKLQVSSRKLTRVQEMFKQDFLPAQAHDDALNEKQIAEAELREAQDSRRLADIEYRRQMTLIQLKSIKSPINGVVTERVLNVGELAEAGVGRKPILRLADIEMLYVEALLPAAAYPQVKLGMTGEIVPAIGAAPAERATISVIDRVLDAGSGTFGIRMELPNARRTLLAGVRCKVRLDGVQVAASQRSGDAAKSTDPRAVRPNGSPAAPPKQ